MYLACRRNSVELHNSKGVQDLLLLLLSEDDFGGHRREGEGMEDLFTHLVATSRHPVCLRTRARARACTRLAGVAICMQEYRGKHDWADRLLPLHGVVRRRRGSVCWRRARY